MIAAVMKGNGLYQKYRLNSARTMTLSSQVNNIEGMVLWLDATKQDTIINNSDSTDLRDNDTIKTWKSTNPQNKYVYDFSQGSESLKPHYIRNGIGNLPAIVFETNADGSVYEALENDFALPLSPSQFTIFSVINPIQNTSSWGTVYMFRGGGTSYSGFNLYKHSNSNYWSFWTGDSSTWNKVIEANLGFNNPQIVTTMRSATNSKVYVNGTLGGDEASTYDINSQNTSKFYIGSGNGNYGFDGYISEIIMFRNALSDEDRQAVESYLTKKYSINI